MKFRIRFKLSLREQQGLGMIKKLNKTIKIYWVRAKVLSIFGVHIEVRATYNETHP